MFKEIAESDYLFFFQGKLEQDKIRYNLIEPLLSMEHIAYKWEDGSAACVIHKETIVLWNDEAVDTNLCIFEELINIIEMRKINITKVLGAEEFAKRFLLLYCCGIGRKFKHSKSLVAYYCTMACIPNLKGEMILSAKGYESIVSEFMEKFDEEAFDGVRNHKSYMPIAQQLIKENAVFLWQDKGHIVSMCIAFFYSSNCARINYVYTSLNARGNGYATMLVSSASHILLTKGLLPVLYADKNNKWSTSAYLKAGFNSAGQINEYTILF